MQIEKLIRGLSKSLLKWYEFEKGAKALYVADGLKADEPLEEALSESGLEVDSLDAVLLQKNVERQEKYANARYDYIVLAGALEQCRYPEDVLQFLKDMLKPSGKLLVGADNRLGLRYFCGEKDPFTLRVYDGIEDYAKVGNEERDKISGRNYSMSEIKGILKRSGFEKYKFYSVFPELKRPQILLAEGYIPNETLDIRVFPQYSSPETIFLEEEGLYDTLIKEGMLHVMANGYFIECTLNGTLCDADQVTVSSDRGEENSLATIIRAGKSVAKKALYREGKEKIRTLLENTEYLKAHHVPVVNASVCGKEFVMPYVEGEIATAYFQELLQRDREEFLAELTRFFDIILKSSEQVPYSEINWEHFEPGWERRKEDDPNIDKWKKIVSLGGSCKQDIGVILKRGFIDMISLNCFYSEGNFLFFDQEFYMENLPANVIMLRTIDCIYRRRPVLQGIMPQDDVLKHFHLYKYKDTWRKYEWKFLENIRKEKELASYHKKHRRDFNLVNANRMRMNFSQGEYEKLFFDIFRNVYGKKLYLFGSGSFAEKFLEKFGSELDIAGVFDNNEERWGKRLGGIEIQSPETILGIKETCKIIICIKQYEEILNQLKHMGVKDISIYSPYIDYSLPVEFNQHEKKEDGKKYNIGYVAGVFDLFHIGHLNLLKRAKQQCNYLIVGVVSDEQVMKDKMTTPYIPFEERLEIVKACKYVDKAVKIPINYPTTEDAFRKYQFDVQFSGSDYENDPIWLAKKTFLRQHGSDLVFFPYTESTSSSKIKKQVEKRMTWRGKS